MEKSMSKRSKSTRDNTAADKVKVASPRLRERDVAKKWTAQLFREGSASGPAFVEYTFPTQDGSRGRLRVPLSELRHPTRLLDQFYDHMPVFPSDMGGRDRDQIEFLKAKMDRRRGSVEVIPTRTGFIDKNAFATWNEIIRADGRPRPIPRERHSAGDPPPDIKGTLEGSSRNVLRLARHSTFLAFSIGVALAAPLSSYLRLYREADDPQDLILTETAVFNFSGKSSSGKSSAGLAAMSLIGSPERVGTMNFTERGLAEYAAESNDLVLIADDTEKSAGDLVKALRLLTHIIPGGRSQTKFPDLRWSTFVLCSSPRPIPILAAELGWSMSRGDKVRLFDINVPPPEKGGIFDRIPGGPAKRAKRSIKLIHRLERGYLNNYGHIFPKWMAYLLASNRSTELVEAANEFVRRVGAEDNGWQKRFAQKFGIIYAAMTLGIKSGVLPWPEELPLKVAIKCYRRACKGASSDAEIARDLAKRLFKTVMRPGRLVLVPKSAASRSPLTCPPGCVGLRYHRDNREKIGLFDD
jgi:hypothetical protein